MSVRPITGYVLTPFRQIEIKTFPRKPDGKVIVDKKTGFGFRCPPDSIFQIIIEYKLWQKFLPALFFISFLGTGFYLLASFVNLYAWVAGYTLLFGSIPLVVTGYYFVYMKGKQKEPRFFWRWGYPEADKLPPTLFECVQEGCTFGRTDDWAKMAEHLEENESHKYAGRNWFFDQDALSVDKEGNVIFDFMSRAQGATAYKTQLLLMLLVALTAGTLILSLMTFLGYRLV